MRNADPEQNPQPHAAVTIIRDCSRPAVPPAVATPLPPPTVEPATQAAGSAADSNRRGDDGTTAKSRPHLSGIGVIARSMDNPSVAHTTSAVDSGGTQTIQPRQSIVSGAPLADAAAEAGFASGLSIAETIGNSPNLSIPSELGIANANKLRGETVLNAPPAGEGNSKDTGTENSITDGSDSKSKGSEAASVSSAGTIPHTTGEHPPVPQPDVHPSAPASGAGNVSAPTAAPLQDSMASGSAHAAVVPSSTGDREPVLPTVRGNEMTPMQAHEIPATSTVNSASVVQKMSETEMRVAVNLPDLGAISIRTSLSPQQMMTQITVEHDDLSRTLTSHVAAMEMRLGNELGMRALVQVNQPGMAFGGEGGGSAHRERESLPEQADRAFAVQAGENNHPGPRAALEAMKNSRLDIRA